MTTSPFALALCQAGAEPWLKQEVARVRPDLHASYQRPGVVTFKATGEPFRPDEAPASVFARVWACAAGPVKSIEDAVAVAERVGATHLWIAPRDQGLPDMVPPLRIDEVNRHAAEVEAALRASGRFAEGEPSKGDRVLNVVTSPGEPLVVGWHDHGPGRHHGPGGRMPVPARPDAPSRAYAKMAEGLYWSGAAVGGKDMVLELGSAPGGGTLALLERGARVLAVDTQPMDDSLLVNPSMRWIRRAAGDVRFEELPLREVTWIACDVHLAPVLALNMVRRFVVPVRDHLKGLLLTLKLNDDATVEALPRLLEQIQGWGAREVRALQLPSNRHDLFVYAPFDRPVKPRVAKRPGPARR